MLYEYVGATACIMAKFSCVAGQPEWLRIMAFMERLTSNEQLEKIRGRLPSVAASMPDGLRLLPAAAELEAVLAALWRDGAVVLEKMVPCETADRVISELCVLFKEKNGREATDEEVQQWMQTIKEANLSSQELAAPKAAAAVDVC